MPMKLGLLGMWHSHADGIVRQASAHPEEFSLVGFWDPEPDVVRERTNRWRPIVPGFRVFPSAEALLREPLDGVVVESRVHENLRLAKLALESARPVMLEKPAGDKLDEYRRLIDLAQKKHLHVQMVYLFRYMAAVHEGCTPAGRGGLGRLHQYRGRLPKN